MLPADVMMKVMESIETGDMETTGIYLSESAVVQGFTPEALNKYQFLNVMTSLFDAIPNWSFNANSHQEKGAVAKAKVRISGTNTGILHLPAFGIQRHEPTGIRFSLPEERVTFTVRDNKIFTIKFDRVSGGGITGIFERLHIRLPEKVAV